MQQQETPENPSAILKRLRYVLVNGGKLLLESLRDQELVAMQTLIESGEAEIVNSACRPYLAARVDRTIIDH